MLSTGDQVFPYLSHEPFGAAVEVLHFLAVKREVGGRNRLFVIDGQRELRAFDGDFSMSQLIGDRDAAHRAAGEADGSPDGGVSEDTPLALDPGVSVIRRSRRGADAHRRQHRHDDRAQNPRDMSDLHELPPLIS